MSLVQVKKIYQDETLIGLCNTLGTVNCARLSGDAKPAWLTFNDGIVPIKLVFQDPLEDSAIKGVWVDEAGAGILIDGDVADFVAKCNACCGTNAVVTPIYNGVYPTLQSPLAKTYTVTRADNGMLWDTEKIGLDYLRAVIPNTLGRTSRNASTGVSTYTFQSYKSGVTPQANKFQVADTITQAPLTFDSNVPAALSGNRYAFTLKTNGIAKGTPTPIYSTVSVADLVSQLNANTTYTAYGTYSVVAGAVRLTTTVTDAASLAIAVVALP